MSSMSEWEIRSIGKSVTLEYVVGPVIECWTSRTREASAGRSGRYASDLDRRGPRILWHPWIRTTLIHGLADSRSRRLATLGDPLYC